MIVKQGHRAFELARKFAASAQLSDVRLASCKVWSQRQWSGSEAKSEVSFKVAAPDIGEKVAVLPISFSARMVDNTTETDIFGIECELEGNYFLRTDYRPSLGEVAAFQEANAVYHYWPFFREIVQNTSVRAGYPPIPIPHLMLSVEKSESEKPIKRVRLVKTPE